MNESPRCRIGLHDWEFLYYADRLSYVCAIGVHECRRCGERAERSRLVPLLV